MDGRFLAQVFAMTRLSLWISLFFSPAVSFHDGDESRNVFFVKPPERSIDDGSQINGLVSFEKSQSLAGGRYVTTTDTRQILALGQDLLAIDRTENFEEIERIYRVGNAGISNETDANGLFLAGLSLEMSQEMIDDPDFIIFRNTFSDKGRQNGEKQGYFRSRRADFYADTIVSDTISRRIVGIQSEAILALQVWMATNLELNSVLVNCAYKFYLNESLAALDRAATFWIGVEDGASSGGYLMHHLAESASVYFNKSTDEALVNTQIIDGLASLQSAILTGDLCLDGKNHTDLKGKIARIKSLTIVPLLQNLIHYVMVGEEPVLTQIYLAAIIPHIAACDENLVEVLDINKINALNETDKLSWVGSLQRAFSCMKVSCEDIGNYTQDSSYPQCEDDLVAQFAGYVATNPESELYSRMDRDLQRLRIFLNEEALGPALDLYRQGYHAPFSLQSMALNKVIPQGSDSIFFANDTLGFSTHDSTYQPDQELLLALQRNDMFRNLTSKQLSQVILGLLSYHVSFVAITSALTVAKEKCGQETTAALDYWDIAAGLYIGSTNTATDQGSNGGPLLYGVSRAFCSIFDTCSNGNSLVNKVMLDAFSAGKSSISNGDCVALENVIDESVIPALQTIVIQGILASAATFATSDDTRSTTTSPGLVHSFARTLIPLLHEADPGDDAWTKSQLLLPAALTLSQSSIYDLAQVLYTALPHLDTDCKAVGTLLALNLSLCQDIRLQLPINKMTFGRYLFSDSDLASQIASIALDIRDMENASSMQEALHIYRQGRNANSSRHEQVTLSSFSVEATRWMGDNPIFNLYKYALYNESAVEFHNSTYPYADELISKAKNKQLLIEASVALNVWMMISHYLWAVWRTCSTHEDASHDVDAAVALWIGEGQQEGSFGNGWLVYSLTQDAAQRFGHSEQEAVVNTKLMESFNTLQRISKSCSETPHILPDIWGKVLEVQRLLTIPLVQMLLSAIADNDPSRAAIYSLSVIPQSIGCNQKLYANLSEWLLFTSDYKGLNDTALDDLALFLECLDISCDDLNVTTTAPQKLQNVVGRLCAAQERSRTTSPSTDPIFRAASRINLDVLQIEIQLRTRSYQAAHDLYLYGRNVNISGLEWPDQLGQSSLVSLRSLATLPGNSTILEDYSEYYGSPRYADNLVMESLLQEGVYSNISSNLVALDSSALLQTLVFFQGIIWYLDAAVSKCEVGQLDVAKQSMLLAMGIFHGFPSGFSFRTLGDALCIDFGTCAVRGGSTSNQVVLKLLQDGFSSLRSSQQCQEVKDSIENDVIPLLKIPLIQALLERAVFRGAMADNAAVEAHSSGFALSQAILPLLANTNSESAEIIQDIFGSPQESIASWEETESVFEAVQYALPGMNINCTYMGRWVREPLLSFCYDVTVADDEKNPYSKFGMDIDEMQRALHNGASELARTIYTSGKNVVLNGTAVSLQSVYMDATPAMATEPIFQLYRISHGGNPLYADSIIQGAFNHTAGSTKHDVARTLASTSPIAAEAVVVLILWMSVLHEINRGLQVFEQSNGSPQELSNAINRSRAYWIGDAQLRATEPGHALYGWANEMSSHFTGVDGIMPGVNDYMLTMFADMQTVIGSVSTSNSTDVARLFDVFKEMIHQMTIPLVQGLVHALMINDKERVKLYAQAVFPLVATCDRTEEQQMIENSKMINATFVTTEIDGMIDHIYHILLPCLGLTCRQVGLPKSDAANVGFDKKSSCIEDDPANKSYRGYQPRSSEVFEYVMRMGQDLREIELLLEAKAFSAAEQVYIYGHNGKSSLQDLARGIAVSLNDTVVGEAFSSYYSNDFYSDELVSNAIRDGLFRQGSNTTVKLSDEERRIVAVGFSQMVVLPHAALGSMRDAWSACRDPGAKDNDNKNNLEALDAWDRAAALLLGSGRLSPFDMGQVYCRSFGTCDAKTGVAESNEMILDLLYAGRGALAQANATTLLSHTNHSHCDVLSKVSNKIQAQVWVPMIQAILQSAFDAAQEKTPEAMIHAFVSSRAILPLIQESNPSIASRLTELIPLHQQSHVSANTGAVVMDLLSQVYKDLYIECEWIGRLGEYNPCESNNANQYASTHQHGLSTGGLVAVLLCAVMIAMIIGYFCWKQKRVKKERSTNGDMMAESNPTLLTMSDHCDGDALPWSPKSASSTVDDDCPPVFSSRVDKSRGRPSSDSTLDTLDLQLIQNSFQSSHSRLSSKADRTLNRISSYGDDDEAAVVDEDLLLQLKEKSAHTDLLP